MAVYVVFSYHPAVCNNFFVYFMEFVLNIFHVSLELLPFILHCACTPDLHTQYLVPLDSNWDQPPQSNGRRPEGGRKTGWRFIFPASSPQSICVTYIKRNSPLKLKTSHITFLCTNNKISKNKIEKNNSFCNCKKK